MMAPAHRTHPMVAVFIAEPNHPRGGFHHKQTNTPFVAVTREANASLVVVGGGCDDEDGGMGRGDEVEKVVTR
ncbi:hypothetical protein Tco_0466722, partial [Tanacetum coccineum]